jgi:hypothetical protein
VAAVASLLLAGTAFIASPKTTPKSSFNPVLAASSFLPVLTMLADDAEAKYGDSRRWSAVMVPLTTLVLPGIAAGTFVLWLFSDDLWWQRNPDSKKWKAYQQRWREHAVTADVEDPFSGLINKDDFEEGFVEAWEKAKPAGCNIDARKKLRELEKQNNPHWRPNRLAAQPLSA